MVPLPSLRLIAVTALVAWAALVGLGLQAYFRYQVNPGERGAEQLQWPTASTLPRSTTTPTLIMFVHPSCPCSRASIAELASIVTSTKVRPRIVVVFVTDEAGGHLWDSVGEIAGAERILDPSELEAARFGARTSGYVVVYDAEGRLAYAGGLTGSRGHVGDNMGKRSVQGVLEGLAPVDARYGVFGCMFAARGAKP